MLSDFKYAEEQLLRCLKRNHPSCEKVKIISSRNSVTMSICETNRSIHCCTHFIEAYDLTDKNTFVLLGMPLVELLAGPEMRAEI